jgi:hypothetical protein
VHARPWLAPDAPLAACSTRAHHSFCRTCILSALARAEACPLDGGALTRATLVPNRMLAAHLADLPVRCTNAAAWTSHEGADAAAVACAWTGPLGKLSQHLRSECGAATVACPNVRCDATCARRDASAHAALCAHTRVPCAVPGCGAHMARGRMQAHMRNAEAPHAALLHTHAALLLHAAGAQPGLGFAVGPHIFFSRGLHADQGMLTDAGRHFWARDVTRSATVAG